MNMKKTTLASILMPLSGVYYSEDGFGQYPAWFADGDTATGVITGAIYPMMEITNRQYWGDVCGQPDVFHNGEVDDADDPVESMCYYDALTANISSAALASSDVDPDVLDELIEQLTHDLNANPPPEDHAAAIMRGVLADLTALAESIN